MAQVTRTTGYGDTETEVTIDIPDAVISAAAEAAFDADRIMVVGKHPYFGWVYRDLEDEGALRELSDKFPVDGEGLVEARA